MTFRLIPIVTFTALLGAVACSDPAAEGQGTERFTTWGESHGPAIGCVIDGVPPLIPLSEDDIQP